MAETTEFLVIGAGSIGQRHHNNLTELGLSSQLLSIRETGTTAACDAIANLPDLKGVVIATATPLRLPIIEACAAAHVPFYVEKPLAFTEEDVNAIALAAGEIAAQSMVGYMMRYHPLMPELRQIDLSDIYGFDLEIGHDVLAWRENWSFAGSYASDPKGGGVLLDLCHEIDIIKTLLPDLTLMDVTSLGHREWPGVDFSTRVTLGSATRHGTVAMDYLSPASFRQTRLHGQALSIDVDWLSGSIVKSHRGGPERVQVLFDRNAMFVAAIRDFVDLAFERPPSSANPLIPTLDNAYASARMIAAAWERRRFTGTIKKVLN